MAIAATSTTGLSSRTIVDCLLTGKTWSNTHLSYSFRTAAPTDSDYATGFAPLNATQMIAARQALTRWASVCNLTFTEVADETDDASGVIRFGTCSSSVVATSLAYYPNSAEFGGDVWFGNSSASAARNPQVGNYAYDTFVHELGHSLGLKHPHSAYGIFPTADITIDAMQNSIMSYRSYLGDSYSGGYSNASDSYAYGPMAYDIAAVQYLYGANFSYNAGDTYYRFDPARARIFATVWDGGGIDTYDLSAYTTPVSVDLRPGEWTISSVDQLAQLNYYEVAYGYSLTLVRAPGNICNAYLYNGDTRSLIENAVGGTAADTLVGNQAANLLQGGLGDDTLTLGDGADTVAFARGDGNDYLTDSVFSADDVICLQGIAHAEWTVSASDSRIWVGMNGSSDLVAWSRSGGNPAVSAAGDRLVIANTGTAGASYSKNCCFYAGTSTNGADCVNTDAFSGVGPFDLSDSSLYYSVECFDNRGNASGGNVIRGSVGNNVLTAAGSAGAGDQLWGRVGDDRLVAGNGSDTLWYGLNEGNDTVSGGNAADVVRLYNVNFSDLRYELQQGDLLVHFSGSGDVLRVAGWATGRARLATADQLLPFTPLVEATRGDTLVGGSAEGKATLDLTAYPGLNHVDNSANAASSGSILRGNAGGNVLQASAAGSGDQLWGRGGDDTLVGGAGQDTFWYGANEGNDVITTSLVASSDKIMLYTAMVPADATVNVAGADLVIAMGSGSLTLTKGAALVNDTGGVFKLANGQSCNVVRNGLTGLWSLQ